MKLVTAVIKPGRLASVKEALQSMGIAGMTVSDVQGYGRQKGATEVYRGAQYTLDFSPKVRIEVLIEDGDAQKVVDQILTNAANGEIGDGKIWITSVEDVIRVRTGERGSAAL